MVPASRFGRVHPRTTVTPANYPLLIHLAAALAVESRFGAVAYDVQITAD
jgi:hypothetical protein